MTDTETALYAQKGAIGLPANVTPIDDADAQAILGEQAHGGLAGEAGAAAEEGANWLSFGVSRAAESMSGFPGLSKEAQAARIKQNPIASKVLGPALGILGGIASGQAEAKLGGAAAAGELGDALHGIGAEGAEAAGALPAADAAAEAKAAAESGMPMAEPPGGPPVEPTVAARPGAGAPAPMPLTPEMAAPTPPAGEAALPNLEDFGAGQELPSKPFQAPEEPPPTAETVAGPRVATPGGPAPENQLGGSVEPTPAEAEAVSQGQIPRSLGTRVLAAIGLPQRLVADLGAGIHAAIPGVPGAMLAMAAEGSIYGLGNFVSEQALGQNDDIAESLFSNVGLGGVFGAALGGIGGLVSAHGLPKGEQAMADLLDSTKEDFKSAFARFAASASGAPKEQVLDLLDHMDEAVEPGAYDKAVEAAQAKKYAEVDAAQARLDAAKGAAGAEQQAMIGALQDQLDAAKEAAQAAKYATLDELGGKLEAAKGAAEAQQRELQDAAAARLQDEAHNHLAPALQQLSDYADQQARQSLINPNDLRGQVVDALAPQWNHVVAAQRIGQLASDWMERLAPLYQDPARYDQGTLNKLKSSLDSLVGSYAKGMDADAAKEVRGAWERVKAVAMNPPAETATVAWQDMARKAGIANPTEAMAASSRAVFEEEAARLNAARGPSVGGLTQAKRDFIESIVNSAKAIEDPQGAAPGVYRELYRAKQAVGSRYQMVSENVREARYALGGFARDIAGLMTDEGAWGPLGRRVADQNEAIEAMITARERMLRSGFEKSGKQFSGEIDPAKVASYLKSAAVGGPTSWKRADELPGFLDAVEGLKNVYERQAQEIGGKVSSEDAKLIFDRMYEQGRKQAVAAGWDKDALSEMDATYKRLRAEGSLPAALEHAFWNAHEEAAAAAVEFRRAAEGRAVAWYGNASVAGGLGYNEKTMLNVGRTDAVAEAEKALQEARRAPATSSAVAEAERALQEARMSQSARMSLDPRVAEAESALTDARRMSAEPEGPAADLHRMKAMYGTGKLGLGGLGAVSYLAWRVGLPPSVILPAFLGKLAFDAARHPGSAIEGMARALRATRAVRNSVRAGVKGLVGSFDGVPVAMPAMAAIMHDVGIGTKPEPDESRAEAEARHGADLASYATDPSAIQEQMELGRFGQALPQTSAAVGAVGVRALMGLPQPKRAMPTTLAPGRPWSDAEHHDYANALSVLAAPDMHARYWQHAASNTLTQRMAQRYQAAFPAANALGLAELSKEIAKRDGPLPFAARRTVDLLAGKTDDPQRIAIAQARFQTPTPQRPNVPVGAQKSMARTAGMFASPLGGQPLAKQAPV